MPFNILIPINPTAENVKTKLQAIIISPIMILVLSPSIYKASIYPKIVTEILTIKIIVSYVII